MARMMRDGHLGFAHLREIDPPKTPRISGRYLDRWVGVWENACNVPDAFQRMSRDLGEFWLLDQWFTVGIRGYVQSTAGVWLSESPVSFLESAIFHASYARHPDHVRNLELKRADLYQRLCGAVRGAPPEAMTRLGRAPPCTGPTWRTYCSTWRTACSRATSPAPEPPRYDAHAAGQLGTPTRLDTDTTRR